MNITIKNLKPVESPFIKPSILLKPKEKNDEAVTRRLDKITAKLKSGKRLSPDEKCFLLKYSPGLYQTAKKVEIQRNALKSQLEHARSKQEANEIVGNALSGVSKKDPDMEYIIAAIQDEAKEFQKSDAYKKLPTISKDTPNAITYLPSNKQGSKRKSLPYDGFGMYSSNGEYI